MKYKKWRELIVDPFAIPFKRFKLIKIVNYLPAGNDVLECLVDFNGKDKRVFLKIERSKMADFQAEMFHLNLIYKLGYYNKISQVLEFGNFQDKDYLVLAKISGLRLSEILKKEKNYPKKKEYLMKYGRELAVIHKIPVDNFKEAKQRIINDIPKKEVYKNFDSFILKYIRFLEKNSFPIEYNSFIHGDFHYANVLWKKERVSGVLDFEYSGKGFKEQDIAWALVLRPGQTFMDQYEDIKFFLDGYKSIGNYDTQALKWCLINGYCHFYLMNSNNEVYINQLKELLKIVIQCDLR